MDNLVVKKMKQGMSYSCKEKTIILNVFKYFRVHHPDKCVTEIVRRTAKATGCSEKSIFQFRKEEASVEGFKTPSTTKIRRNININSREIKYDNTVRQAIRTIVHELKYKNIVPSLNTIVRQVNDSPHLPKFSLMTLRRLLFDMGFFYEKHGNKSVLVEKPAIKEELRAERLPNKTAKAKKATKKKEVINHQLNMTNNDLTISQLPRNNVMPPPNHLHAQLPIVIRNNPSSNHMGPPPSMPMGPHGMPMVINHGLPPSHSGHPSNLNMHLKHEIPHWMHHHHPPHTMMTQD